MRERWILALAASLIAATSELMAQQQKLADPLPADIVAAWEKAGAQKSLKSLNLTGTGPKGALKSPAELDLRFLVTDTGVAELQKALPEVRIMR